MEATSVEQPSRAVYIFPAALLLAGLIFVASRPAVRPPGATPLSPQQLPLTNAPPRRVVKKQITAEAPVSAKPPSVATAATRQQRTRLERMPPVDSYSDLPAASQMDLGIPNYTADEAPIEPPAASEVRSQRGSDFSASSAATANPFRSQRESKPVVLAEPSSPEAVRAAFQQSVRLIERGKRLAEKQAHRSAATEFRQALVIVAETLDRQDNGRRRQELHHAFVAFEECDELFAMSKRVHAVNLTSLVLAHDTPILRGKDCTQLSLRAAMEMYLDFAEQQFVAALKDAPAASSGLFFLGKLHMSQTVQGASLAGPKSIACLQAAVRINPEHHYAANELGVSLARYGQWSDAKTALLQSLRVEPTVEAWNNLSMVHQQLQEASLAQLAAQEASTLTMHRRRQSPLRASRDINQVVTWVSPTEFQNTAFVGGGSTAAPPGAPPLQAQNANRGTPAAPVSAPNGIRPPWRQPSR